ncbi:MAG: F0F1 ATP synthase subunit A [Gemmatimonadota bacterium]|nr:MAG: F0F1 ATP synthase subunit A [Gemmatimonadota bacterium]
MHLLEHFELHPIVELHLFGIDMSITKAVIMMWVACALLFILSIIATRRSRLIPSGLQNIMEVIINFLRNSLVLETMGKEGLPWFPFIATLFLFILICNLLGLIPGSFTATSNINVTAALAIMVFLAVQGVGVYKHGPIKYLKGFIPSGIPLWILPIMIPIEIISQFAKPFSLAIRLFANMLAGHGVILVFLFLILSLKSFIFAILPLTGVVVMSAFEIFVAGIQAYIFTILAAMYISAAIHIEH